MIILAIETSCDETAIAVLECSGDLKQPRFKILSNVVASQIKIHAQWGGVVPNLAKREHQRNLPIVLKKALKRANFSITNFKFLISNQTPIPKSQIPNIDLIAVTIGPGLEPALWTGINFAKELAKKWRKPLIGINHMEGHIVASFLSTKHKAQSTKLIKFPTLALLVSGGHTELVLIKSPPAGGGWKYKIIGQTRDDAAGEAFDKVAKMLGLGYPGGPEISKRASKFKSEILNSKSETNTKYPIRLPRPMLNSKDYDFSFSGLKTAVLYLLRDLRTEKFGSRRIPLDDRPQENQLLGSICAEFQQAVIDVLISKTLRAAKEYRAKTIILGGGVAANDELRKQLKENIKKKIPNTKYLIPNIEYTGDNAAMIAATAYFYALRKKFSDIKKLKANGNLSFSTKQ